LKEMFKHRPSRYNFLDLSKTNCRAFFRLSLLVIVDNNLAGDERIAHLKDRMRECQKVFFNLKSALVKVEKQRKVFLRKQKPLINVTTTGRFDVELIIDLHSLFSSCSTSELRNLDNIHLYIE
jgi:hypothetical protein